MTSEPTSRSATQIVRALLLLVGALLIIYALSDHPLYGGESGFGLTQILIVATGTGIAFCGLLPASIAGRILMLAVTCLLMLAIAEIAAEVILGPRLRPIFQPDERLIFKFIPNRSSTMTLTPGNGGATVTHRINSEGFRGDELRPFGEASRIIVYGDSFIHAYYSPHQETFAAGLGSLLAARFGEDVEIINAGVSSYGPDQISLKMEEELPRLRPDLAVVAIYAGNDYGDLMRHKIFRLGTDGSLKPNPWMLHRKVHDLFDLAQQESILKRALRNAIGTAPQSSAFSEPVGDSDQGTGAIAMDFLLAEADREYRSFVVERNDIVTNTHVGYYAADVSLTPKSESARYKIALMEMVMRRIRDVAALTRVPIVFLFIPHPVDVTDHYDGWRIDRKRFPDYDGRNQIAPLETMAQAMSLPFVSLYDVFRAQDANALYFHDGDDHWNDAGQRVAATVVADYLFTHGFLGNGRAGKAPGHAGPSQ